ncbi:MAG: hypothetical protein HYT12_03260 [Candidatus Liptonbacteria bacterium]|nr:hypothetical protein [Candidatus Liptonbacteria bacterium]
MSTKGGCYEVLSMEEVLGRLQGACHDPGVLFHRPFSRGHDYGNTDHHGVGETVPCAPFNSCYGILNPALLYAWKWSGVVVIRRGARFFGTGLFLFLLPLKYFAMQNIRAIISPIAK